MTKYIEEAKVIGQWVLNAVTLNAVTRELDMIAPKIAAEAVPGQFVNVQVSRRTAPLLRRPLGVAGVDRKRGVVRLVYRFVGEATNILGDVCNGDRLLAPLLFLAESMAEAGIRPDVLMGGRTADDLFWKDMYQNLVERMGLTTDDGSLGTEGTVMAELPLLLRRIHYDCVYVCGPAPMMKAVSAAVLEKGIKCQVSLERRQTRQGLSGRPCVLGGGGDGMVRYLYHNRLAVDIAGLKMKTPVTTASGTFGFGLEFTDFLDLEKVGAITVKGTTLAPRAGNKGQRVVETPSGILNCIGLENPGSDYFLKETLPKLKKYNVPVIVNIDASSPEEYGELAAKLDVKGGLSSSTSTPPVRKNTGNWRQSWM